ncbi:peptide ABC transporter permease [Methanobrevibacter sp.]|uniref:peptide ABC transporter permease n=1 Tax=Methanobrevibacter sp. TaxID=66852 RepID=UPI00388F6FCD
MFDLIFSYLLITTILFSANIGLFFGNFRLNNIKSSLIFMLIGIILFIVVFTSSLLTFSLGDYLAYIFILISIIIFIIMIVYLKINIKLMPVISATIILYYITSFLLASQLNEYVFNGLLLSVVSIIVMIVAFQSSKLLIFAKRPYDVIIGEFMSLSGILIFIFGLTYVSIMNLDYKMFSSFLILTPTYQLIYVIIGIVIVLIIGSYWNDKKNLR